MSSSGSELSAQDPDYLRNLRHVEVAVSFLLADFASNFKDSGKPLDTFLTEYVNQLVESLNASQFQGSPSGFLSRGFNNPERVAAINDFIRYASNPMAVASYLSDDDEVVLPTTSHPALSVVFKVSTGKFEVSHSSVSPENYVVGVRDSRIAVTDLTRRQNKVAELAAIYEGFGITHSTLKA